MGQREKSGRAERCKEVDGDDKEGEERWREG